MERLLLLLLLIIITTTIYDTNCCYGNTSSYYMHEYELKTTQKLIKEEYFYSPSLFLLFLLIFVSYEPEAS